MFGVEKLPPILGIGLGSCWRIRRGDYGRAVQITVRRRGRVSNSISTIC